MSRLEVSAQVNMRSIGPIARMTSLFIFISVESVWEKELLTRWMLRSQFVVADQFDMCYGGGGEERSFVYWKRRKVTLLIP
jgi:hypothetical protein